MSYTEHEGHRIERYKGKDDFIDICWECDGEAQPEVIIGIIPRCTAKVKGPGRRCSSPVIGDDTMCKRHMEQRDAT